MLHDDQARESGAAALVTDHDSEANEHHRSVDPVSLPRGLSAHGFDAPASWAPQPWPMHCGPRVSSIEPPTEADASRGAGKGSRHDAVQLLVAAPRTTGLDAAELCQAVRLRGYGIRIVMPSSGAELSHALGERDVRVLLLDVDLLDSIGLAELLRLKRRFPATDWLLTLQSRSPQWVDLVIRLEARGCIDWTDSRSVMRAIDAVIAGDLWFPRWLSHALYFALLAAVRVARLDVVETLETVGAALTRREAESLDLMRQGLTNKEIARRLEVSVNTVKKHLKSAFDKRGLHSRRQAIG